ncbi:MAG: carbamoyl phosphate synthase small subunit, partial [Clostridia bacterium]|nr:carbamoyl phosphate synthase small subunit [Clostridia bacterium]
NHGYAVVSESIDPAVAAELFVNAHDGTCEGIEYKGAPAFAVQFHPEACAGPRDTEFLFDRFIKLMEVNKNASR